MPFLQLSKKSPILNTWTDFHFVLIFVYLPVIVKVSGLFYPCTYASVDQFLNLAVLTLCGVLETI